MIKFVQCIHILSYSCRLIFGKKLLYWRVKVDDGSYPRSFIRTNTSCHCAADWYGKITTVKPSGFYMWVCVLSHTHIIYTYIYIYIICIYIYIYLYVWYTIKWQFPAFCDPNFTFRRNNIDLSLSTAAGTARQETDWGSRWGGRTKPTKTSITGGF